MFALSLQNLLWFSLPFKHHNFLIYLTQRHWDFSFLYFFNYKIQHRQYGYIKEGNISKLKEDDLDFRIHWKIYRLSMTN